MALFTAEQQQSLLTLARAALTAAVAERRVALPDAVDTAFHAPLGAFVTLTIDGELRGCIGYPEPLFPLYETIVRAAASAALQDPRFPPVSPRELPEINIEVSVLSPLAPIAAEAVEVGTHGLVIERGTRRGLLLPQVPAEYGWTREEFLGYTCRKAGLPGDAWRDPDAKLFGFTAEVFGEEVRTG
jgi:AmmeMemoRadiSam system protein A